MLNIYALFGDFRLLLLKVLSFVNAQATYLKQAVFKLGVFKRVFGKIKYNPKVCQSIPKGFI
jgi:hypothetical protein